MGAIQCSLRARNGDSVRGQDQHRRSALIYAQLPQYLVQSTQSVSTCDHHRAHICLRRGFKFYGPSAEMSLELDCGCKINRSISGEPTHFFLDSI